MSVARHTAYNLAGAVVPLLVALVTVPLYLKVIGLDRYGLLAISWLLVGYFGLFDFGLGRATAQKIATLAQAEPGERSRIFWTGAVLSLALSLIAVLVFIPLATFGLQMMKLTDAGLRLEVNAALPFLVAAVPFGIAQSLLVGSLEGRAEFGKVNLMLSLGSVATAALPLAAALWIGPQLSNLLGASLVSRAIVLLLLLVACARAVPLHRPRGASSGEIKRLLRFGGWTTVSSVIGPLLVFLDRFAIGAVISAAAVALYVVPFNLVSQLVLLPAALAAALFPRLAAASIEEARVMSRDGLLVLAFLLTPATLIMLAGAGPFLHWWIGESASRVSAPVAYVLLLGFWTNSLARIPAAHLQASGRPDLLAKIHAAEFIPYLALLYLGMIGFGLVGAALVWSIRCTADALILALVDRVDRRTQILLLPHFWIIIAAIAIMFALPADPQTRWLLLATLAALTAWIMIRNIPPQFAELCRKLGLLRSPKPGEAR